MRDKVYKTRLEVLRKSIVEIEEQIALVIKSDPPINTNYNLFISVPGIGPVIATIF